MNSGNKIKCYVGGNIDCNSEYDILFNKSLKLNDDLIGSSLKKPKRDKNRFAGAMSLQKS